MADILNDKRILLVIGGGIAAYKCLDLIRRLRERGVSIKAILTKGGSEFVTPLSVSSLIEDKVYQDLFSLTDEAEMGHIRLSRENDLILVAPATADLMAKMACGIADNLATTTLLASNKQIMLAPTMNTEMWKNPATQANIATLKERGMLFVDPADGDLACGEVGTGRLAETEDIIATIEAFFLSKIDGPLRGKKITVTAGPTHEDIDPVRYIANRSSGKQGYTIASKLAQLGADVTLISGPTNLATPNHVKRINVTSANEMMENTENTLPADVVICVAAVADWHVKNAGEQKIKKQNGEFPALEFGENPDILKSISNHVTRPGLVIGFAAETENVLDHAKAKLDKKGCDWIVANDVSGDVMGGDDNQIHLITNSGIDTWPLMDKNSVAAKLASKIEEYFKE
ncbi:bifunctional phosphopantothenoylcysteine decarboxylase/phosphopantothenate--cysteine ligase CoaBC [Pseudemcibacter aquimaris]|uniref:bifunctional phosphopantothenoylcysteine decarboxylase/phosphopantothenate--cysteine ligase CoaBC n=1 Tax=Pseudemcibacter aquimaris TaxID=2857064 RepID=UPI00201274C6|nr:bifunctional phosphopantothenoylcysteine decarboxylase/phosphopantothenate--cysteine ligase CoaBC [Pseudemcibacter aquimaris]MCC3861894.1 bifunctional phosphopantothenoylcysteine decarboxylase/phosphopantothenate--cysteine ligase CoaBC [Pseudemcibacter aquimaris]WDU58647.1 bifunctional phosphopantothenoylcysteine decarboxylase/phosphopantothenate--cysteine ligase CoaBC [Pseudemcibacter aquimaris]